MEPNGEEKTQESTTGKPEQTRKTFSRRNFLRLGTLATGATALGLKPKTAEAPESPQELQIDTGPDKSLAVSNEQQNLQPQNENILPNSESLERQDLLVDQAPKENIDVQTQFEKAIEETSSILSEEYKREEAESYKKNVEFIENKRKQKLEKLKINEITKEISPKSAIIDYQFLDKNSQINMIQNPKDEETILKYMLKDKYVSRKELETEFGANFWNNKEILEKVGKKYSKELAAAYGFLHRYHNHGERVGETEKRTLEIFGFRRPPTDFYPLQNKLSPEDIQIHKDELGNIGYLINIRSETVIDAIKKIKDNHSGITRFNLSIHVGSQGFYYEERERTYEVIEPKHQTGLDRSGNELYFPGAEISDIREGTPNGIIIRSLNGKLLEPLTEEEWEIYKTKNTKILIKDIDRNVPDIKEEDAYTPEKAKENLPKIFQVANAFSDSLFFAAAGNNVDDLRELKGTQPKNLIFFAQWDSESNSPYGKVDGADIYVDNYFLGHDAGSSFSTPTLSAAADILESYGLKNEHIRTKLFEACDVVSYKRYNPSTNTTTAHKEVKLFNPEKFKTTVESLKANQEDKKLPHN